MSPPAYALLSLLSLLLPFSYARAQTKPETSAAIRVLIINGLPGDDEHHRSFEKNLTTIRQAFLDRYGIPVEDLKVYYGPEEAGYDGPATRERVLHELETIVERSSAGNGRPVWLIFHGHANRIPGGANLNLPGPDLSTRDLAMALKDFPKETPLVVIAATAAASDFLAALGGPGRLSIAASSPRDPVTEPEFPLAFSAALAAPETDADNNGLVTVLELYQATKQRVIAHHQKEGLMVRENAQLDGNGDGRGTQRPADEDAGPAAKQALTVSKRSRFE